MDLIVGWILYMMPGAELIPKIITDVILEEIPKVPGI